MMEVDEEAWVCDDSDHSTSCSMHCTGGRVTAVRAKTAAHTNQTLDDEELELVLRNEQLIGTGAFSQVYRVDMQAPEETVVAIKRIKHDQHNYVSHERQISIHRTLEHDCICCLLYYYPMILQSEIYWNLVLEFMPTTAFEHCRLLATNKLRLDFESIQIWLCQLCAALAYLHRQSICHRDVKPENLLVEPDTGRLKLGDFGSAKQLNAEDLNSSYQVTRYYRAPELLLGNGRYSCAVDMWAVGCIIYELVTGKVLWAGRNTREQLTLINHTCGTPDTEQLKAIMPGGSMPPAGSLEATVIEMTSPSRVPRLQDQGQSTPVIDQLERCSSSQINVVPTPTKVASTSSDNNNNTSNNNSHDTNNINNNKNNETSCKTKNNSHDTNNNNNHVSSGHLRSKHYHRTKFRFEDGLLPVSWPKKLPSDTPLDCSSLVDSILRYAPDDRLSANECLHHPFIRPALTPCGNYVRLKNDTVASVV